MTTEPDHLLSRQDAASMLGVHRNTLDHWHAAGYGPPRYKLGGRVAYKLSEIDNWVSQQRQGSTARTDHG